MLFDNGAIITDVRGSIGGQTYSKNRYGKFVCNKYRPLNPRTTYQQENRVYLSRSVAAWKQLSEAERLSWNSAAMYLKGSNCFGDSFSYTAYQCYIKCSLVYLACNNDQLYSCPLMSMPRPFRYFSFIIDLEQNTFTFDINASGITGLGTALYATRPLPAGRKPKASDYRRFFLTGSLNLDDNVITTYYVNYFGRFPSPGEYVFMKLCTVDTSAGLISMPLFASAVCSSYLKNITPYNLQQASFNPATRVLSLNASTSAFACLTAVPDASDFSFSFHALGTVGNGSFRINLSTYNTYKPFNDASQLFRMLINPLIPCFTLTQGSTPTVSTQISSPNNYFKIAFINGTVIIYEGSSPDDFIEICRSKLLVSGSLYLVIVNASAYAQQFDYLKFN